MATGGQLGDLFSAPVAAAPTGGSSGNVGLDSFDPRAGSSTGTAAATTTGGFGHEFVGFAPSAPAPVPVATPTPAFPGTGGTAVRAGVLSALHRRVLTLIFGLRCCFCCKDGDL